MLETSGALAEYPYIIALLLGVKLFSAVPELASYLMPGGVASSSGSQMGAMGAAAGGIVGGAAGGALGSASGVGISAAGTLASSQGTNNPLSAIAQNTSLGQKYAQGKQRGAQ